MRIGRYNPLAICVVACIAILARGPSALAFDVSAGALPSPFPMPPPNPDPDRFPTDFHASPPDWTDTSARLPWPNGQQEPEHSYGRLTHIIELNNVFSPIYTKTIWMHLRFNDGMEPQPEGDPFQQQYWAKADALMGTPTPTGASFEKGDNGSLDIYQTWELFPQESKEFIDLTKLLAAVGRDQPDFIWTQTICPEPSLALAAGSWILLLARRRLGVTRRARLSGTIDASVP